MIERKVLIILRSMSKISFFFALLLSPPLPSFEPFFWALFVFVKDNYEMPNSPTCYCFCCCVVTTAIVTFQLLETLLLSMKTAIYVTFQPIEDSYESTTNLLLSSLPFPRLPSHLISSFPLLSCPVPVLSLFAFSDEQTNHACKSHVNGLLWFHQ